MRGAYCSKGRMGMRVLAVGVADEVANAQRIVTSSSALVG